MDSWDKLFNPRQLHGLLVVCDLIEDLISNLEGNSNRNSQTAGQLSYSDAPPISVTCHF